jgi:Ser/Thr protein kinase RdoA (MazF antagonist)
MYRALNHCSQTAGVPRVIPTNEGEYYLEKANHLYVVLEFHEAVPYNGDGAKLREIGSEVAKLHQAMSTLPGDIREHCTVYGSRFNFSEAELREITESLRPLITRKRSAGKAGICSVAEARFILETYENHLQHPHFEGNRQTIHRDLHPDNILVDHTDKILFIDFDALTFGERLRDVAFACHRLARLGVPTQERSLVRERARAFLAGYHRQNSLQEAEVAAVPFFIVDEALRRITYILRGFFQQGLTTWAHVLPKHLQAIREAPLLQTLDL